MKFEVMRIFESSFYSIGSFWLLICLLYLYDLVRITCLVRTACASLSHFYRFFSAACGNDETLVAMSLKSMYTWPVSYRVLLRCIGSMVYWQHCWMERFELRISRTLSVSHRAACNYRTTSTNIKCMYKYSISPLFALTNRHAVCIGRRARHHRYRL